MKYIAPVAEVVALDVVNVILTSGCASDSGCPNDMAGACPFDM